MLWNVLRKKLNSALCGIENRGPGKAGEALKRERTKHTEMTEGTRREKWKLVAQSEGHAQNHQLV